MTFHIFCTNGNMNEYSSVYLLSVANWLMTSQLYHIAGHEDLL